MFCPGRCNRPGLSITGVDIALNQIEEARRLSGAAGMDIEYRAAPADETGLPGAAFDFISAAQCFIYFSYDSLMKEIDRLLKPGGRFIISWFAWLPGGSRVAEASEELILKYNPEWKGAGYERMHFPSDYLRQYGFGPEREISYDEEIPFSRDAWAGRIRACRGIGASLSDELIADFDKEHRKMLAENHPETLSILHHVLICSFKRIA